MSVIKPTKTEVQPVELIMPMRERPRPESPSRCIRPRRRVEQRGSGLELGRIGIAGAYHFGTADHRRFAYTGVIYQTVITGAHLIAQEIPRLVIAYPVPAHAAAARIAYVLDAALRGLRFQQPDVQGALMPAL